MWLYDLVFNRNYNNEINDIRSKSIVAIEYLVKIWLFPKYHNMNTWIISTRRAFHSTNALKRKRGKYLDHDTILMNTYFDHDSKINIIRYGLVEDHLYYGAYPGYMRSNYEDIAILMNCIYEYFDRLAGILCKDGFVNVYEVREIIKNSGLLYIPEERDIS